MALHRQPPPPSSRSTSIVATGILLVMGLAFAGFGSAGFIAGLKKINSSAALKDSVGLCIMGLVFAIIGVALCSACFLGSRAGKRTNAIQAAHPDEPWLWNDKWAGGRILSSTKSTMFGACIFAVFWNAISLPIAIVVLPRELKNGNHLVLLILLFPAVGAGLLFWAVREIIRWNKFGQSVFKMLSVPGVIGGQLSGAIQSAVKIRPQDGFHLRLCCVNRVTTGSGRDAHTSDRIVWEDEKTLVRELLADDPAHSAIPVFFQIPGDSPESNDANARDKIVWRLEVRAKVPGVDYFAQFEVPVFKTADSAAAALVTDPTLNFQAPTRPYELPKASRIRARELPSGGREFVFPALRNPTVALMLGVFVAIFSGATWFMSGDGAPIFFPIVFGLASLGLFAAFFNLVFKSSRVVVDADGLGVVTHWLFLHTAKRLAAADIAAINTKIGMTSGQKVYYDLHVSSSAGRDLTVASAIADKKEAEWLAAEMRRLLKLDNPAPPPTIGA